MQVRVLGSAAGGGSPQWNCHCEVCRAVRAGAPGTRVRTQSSIAVRASDDEPWLLVNASPDVARQLELLDVDVADDAVRDVPFGAVLVTDAEIDHCAGLLLLREGDEPLTLYSTPAAHRALVDDWPLLRMLGSWCGVEWRELVADDRRSWSSFGTLDVEAFTTGHDAPRYQRSPGGPGTSIGVTFHAGGRRVTYCPTLESWSDAIATRFAESDVVLVDGTFWSDDELARRGAPNPRTATQMGHLPVGGADGSARRLAQLADDTRVVLVHVNNSNPILLERGPERAELVDLGIEVAHDGMEVLA
jgi:pyrroloquinoline quinone biosynthesis protein B